MPSPAKDGTSAVPTLLPPSSLYPPPSSPSGPRTLRKLQSAHNLGAKANSNNLPSMISQQRLLQQQQLHNHHQQQAQQQLQSIQALQQRSASPVRRNISNISNTATLGTGSAGNGITTLSSNNNNRSPQRGRANSDAANIQQINAAASANASRRPLLGRSPALDALSIDRLVRDGPPDGDVVGALNNLRWKILETGIKSDGDGMSSARIYVWLILLDCPVLETDAYLSLVHRGASPAYSKIRNDTFRTLTTDPLFRRRVSEASLIRLLNAIAWKLQDVREEKILKHPPMPPPPASRQSLPNLQQQQPAHESNLSGGKGVLSMLNNAAADSSPSANTSPAAKNRARALTLTTEGSETSVSADPGTYVQGMNVLAAPFLYAARSEAEAFVAFHHLLTRECPGYIRGAMDGVHKGLALVDKVLAIVDSKLSLYLLSKNLSAEIYAFPSVLTLCACTPPLPEVLRLWDFLFAYGPHLNIVCIVAQLMMIRNQILTSPSPNKLLRSFPALQADSIKRVTLTIIRKLPADVYAEIVNHAL